MDGLVFETDILPFALLPLLYTLTLALIPPLLLPPPPLEGFDVAFGVGVGSVLLESVTSKASALVTLLSLSLTITSALPAPTAVTTPSSLTVTTLSSLEWYSISFRSSNGYASVSMVYVSPFSSLIVSFSLVRVKSTLPSSNMYTPIFSMALSPSSYMSIRPLITPWLSKCFFSTSTGIAMYESSPLSVVIGLTAVAPLVSPRISSVNSPLPSTYFSFAVTFESLLPIFLTGT